MKLLNGDCLKLMPYIPDRSVDMILADPPYGTTACAWDVIIPFEPMWTQLKRIIKANGAIVMTASQPFTTLLIASNMEDFKYCWVWEKTRASGFIHAKNKPLKIHEDVCVFSLGTTVHEGQSKTRMPYNPQGLRDFGKYTYRPHRDEILTNGTVGNRPSHIKGWIQDKTGYPKSIIKFANPNNHTLHPTQKPVALMEYLIKTYTMPGETVLDFSMGSGSTGVACDNLGRDFIGIELDEKYFKIAEDRIKNNIKPIEQQTKSLLDIF